ncbi:hypothetical protein ACFWAP_00410 [Streptomyces goshikiensis]|uniref:hypothetical protein n=1 Tax=Streptomyces goshikiensis TaxID=1942 RepID=UPI00365C18E6
MERLSWGPFAHAVLEVFAAFTAVSAGISVARSHSGLDDWHPALVTSYVICSVIAQLTIRALAQRPIRKAKHAAS